MRVAVRWDCRRTPNADFHHHRLLLPRSAPLAATSSTMAKRTDGLATVPRQRSVLSDSESDSSPQRWPKNAQPCQHRSK